MPAGVKVTGRQLRWFRFRRSGLDEPFATPEETARRLIGVQAQMPSAADLAFWNRTASCHRQHLQAARLEARSLVRFWGQRNTAHIYAAEDWPFLHTVLEEKGTVLQRRFDKTGLGKEFARLTERIGKRLATAGPLTYKDVRSKRLEEGQDVWVVSYAVFRLLVRQGLACHGADREGRSTFVHREEWLPDLSWSPPPAPTAFPDLVRRYLGTYGPAQPRDLAFWHGTTLARVRAWIEGAGDNLCEIEVEGQGPHLCLRKDLDELRQKAPPPSRWPVRLLYHFDPLLLATKDKTWLIDQTHYKRVWRAAAHVRASLLVGGRIAGTWSYDRKARGLVVRVEPFASLSKPVTRAVEKQATALAKFHDLELASCEIAQVRTSLYTMSQ